MDLIRFLESKLGSGKATQGANIAFYCPFCHHRKQKLEINTNTHKWHCWVCNKRGRSLFSLGRNLFWDKNNFTTLQEFAPNFIKEEVKEKVSSLPPSAKPLWKHIPYNLEQKNALRYVLEERGLTKADIQKYGLHFDDNGPLKGYIIIPSYAADGSINYYTTRSYYSSLPKHHATFNVSKNIVGFELFVNWNLPVVLCEGAFDAMTLSYNEIPLFGKYIQPHLWQTLIWKATNVIIGLDPDAIQKSYEYAQNLIDEGINVSIMHLPTGTDINKIGRTEARHYLFNAENVTYKDILKTRIANAKL